MKLLKWIGKDNITDDFDDEKLITIGQQLATNRAHAKNSMDEWETLIEKAEKLNKPATGTKTFPWRGASNYKSSVFDELSHRFGEQASDEILRTKDLVKTEIVGKVTPDKMAQSDRISTFMSYEINHKMPGWREEQDKLFFCLPNMGQAFKIVEFCPIERRIITDVVYYPDFVVHQKSPSSHALINFTRTLKLSANDVYSYQSQGTWRDIELSFQKESEKERDDGELEEFYEQWTLMDLDEDGYAEPYRITYSVRDELVLRILPLYDEDSIYVEQEGAVVQLSSLQGPLEDKYGPIYDMEGEVGEDGMPVQKEGFIDPEGGEAPTPKDIIKIIPIPSIVPYSFLPSLKNEVLGTGFYPLLVGFVEQINALTNQLTDAGSVANLRGGWLAQGVRLKKGEKMFRPGQYRQTSLSADQLANGIRDIQFAEPSQVLYQLLQDIKGAVKDVAGSVDIEDLTGTNIAASTVLMMLEETQRSSNSIMARITDAMSREYEIMARLIRDYFSQEDYEYFLQTIPPAQADLLAQQEEPQAPEGQLGLPSPDQPAPEQPQQEPPAAQLADDFMLEGINVLPTANPALSTKARKIQQAQMEMENATFLIEAAGVDPRTLAEDWFRSIGITDTERYLPVPTPEEQQKQEEADKKEEDYMWRERDASIRLLETNADMAEGEGERAHASAITDLKKVAAEIQQINAKTIKALEEADETHSTHLADLYRSPMEGVMKMLEHSISEQEMEVKQKQQQLAERQAQLTQGNPNVRKLPRPSPGRNGQPAAPGGMGGMAPTPRNPMVPQLSRG